MKKWIIAVVYKDDLCVYKKRFALYCRAKRKYKQLLEEQTRVNGIPYAYGYSDQYMSTVFHTALSTMTLFIYDETIVNADDEEGLELKFIDYELHTDQLDNRWKEYSEK